MQIENHKLTINQVRAGMGSQPTCPINKIITTHKERMSNKELISSMKLI